MPIQIILLYLYKDSYLNSYLLFNLKLKKMTKEQVMGIVRHALTFVGGILIVKGLAEEGMVTEAIGAVVTAVGAVWSVIKNKTAA